MKAKMIIQYRKAWLFIVGVVLLLALLGAMAVTFILDDHNYGLAILCLVLAAIIFVAIYFRFNYGIKINEKRVVAIEQTQIKILQYDDISSIIIKFTDENIVAYIKIKDQKEYVFIWDHIFLGSNVVLPSKNKIKLNNQFVQKSIASLSQCPKVKIQNFYMQ